MHHDTQIVLIATIIADFIVGLGASVLISATALLIRARRNTVLAGLAPGVAEEPTGALAFVFYGLSLLFWPAGLALGLWFLNKPESTRVGAVCLWMVLVYLAFSVVVAIAIVTAGALYMPELFI